MEDTVRSESKALPVILIAAVIQGWSLYALHLAIDGRHWPATEPGWLAALYGVAVLVPLTVQLLVDQLQQRRTVVLIAAMALLLFYMGWHHGGAVLIDQTTDRIEQSVPLAIAMIVWWLIALPFVQTWLDRDALQPRYRALFSAAWRNKITLAEAGLFTGAMWLLLMLWQQLFHMLGIDFFRELFRKPMFIYPVTSIAFGLALQLIGSVERFTSVVLEQLLNVLKWLAIVAGLILALFTVALLFKLPGLFATGERAIGAAWLLWLIAVTVLLLNAAYRDGSIERPYPAFIAQSLRCIVPLGVVVAVTACYALAVRTGRYGLTVERVWAFIVAGAALIYAVGYSIAAIRGGRWMSGIAQVNIAVALTLLAAIAAALTPVLSPYRLAANSQYRRALNNVDALQDDSDRDGAFRYLQFESGAYGRRRLAELAALQNHPRAVQIRAAAVAAQKLQNRWEMTALLAKEQLASLRLYPSGRVIDDTLKQVVINAASGYLNKPIAADDSAGVFFDLNGDQTEDFALLLPMTALLFAQDEGKWYVVGHMSMEQTGPKKSLASELATTEARAEPPKWQDLVIGKRRYSLSN